MVVMSGLWTIEYTDSIECGVFHSPNRDSNALTNTVHTVNHACVCTEHKHDINPCCRAHHREARVRARGRMGGSGDAPHRSDNRNSTTRPVPSLHQGSAGRLRGPLRTKNQSGQHFNPDAEMLMGEGPATSIDRAPIVVRLALLGTLSESITGTRQASDSLGRGGLR